MFHLTTPIINMPKIVNRFFFGHLLGLLGGRADIDSEVEKYRDIDGGFMVNETVYDSQGRVWKSIINVDIVY
jgi:hypothetical protein